MGAVQKWEVFELLLHGTKEGNPFVSVELIAQFTYQGSENNKPLCVDGFYDGDGIYKVRFMPDRTGVWSYCTHSNQKELDNITGQIECIDNHSDNHGLVRIKNTYHFCYEDGTVYYPFGTTCYAWTHQSAALQKQTIETLEHINFNKIRMCVFPKFYANNSEEPPMYPYQGHAPNQWDFEQFNPQFFQALEGHIIQLGKMGIEVDLILFHPYDKGHWGFDSMGKDADLRYLNYIIARLSAFHNVWWSMANEYDYIKSKSIEDWNTYIKYVSEKDIYKHLLSIHNAERFFDNWHPNITHASIQIGTNSSKGEVSTGFGMYRMHRDIYHKAVIFDEVGYEGDLMQRWGCMSAKEIVDKYWKAICSGTYMSHGETYSNDNDVIWWAKGGQLKGEAWKRILFLKKIVEESGTNGLEPLDLWWILNGVGVHGQYYLFYFSDMPMNQWTFKLPAFKKPVIDMGTKFAIDIIDTWNMTIERLPVEYVVDTSDRYYYQSKTTPFIELKGQQNIALRIVKKELL